MHAIAHTVNFTVLTGIALWFWKRARSEKTLEKLKRRQRRAQWIEARQRHALDWLVQTAEKATPPNFEPLVKYKQELRKRLAAAIPEVAQAMIPPQRPDAEQMAERHRQLLEKLAQPAARARLEFEAEARRRQEESVDQMRSLQMKIWQMMNEWRAPAPEEQQDKSATAPNPTAAAAAAANAPASNSCPSPSPNANSASTTQSTSADASATATADTTTKQAASSASGTASSASASPQEASSDAGAAGAQAAAEADAPQPPKPAFKPWDPLVEPQFWIKTYRVSGEVGAALAKWHEQRLAISRWNLPARLVHYASYPVAPLTRLRMMHEKRKRDAAPFVPRYVFPFLIEASWNMGTMLSAFNSTCYSGLHLDLHVHCTVKCNVLYSLDQGFATITCQNSGVSVTSLESSASCRGSCGERSSSTRSTRPNGEQTLKT